MALRVQRRYVTINTNVIWLAFIMMWLGLIIGIMIAPTPEYMP